MKNSRFLQTLAIQVSGGMSIRDACKAAGCSESTGYNLATTSEFKTEVARIRTEAVEQAVSTLSNAAVKAASALAKLLDSDDEKIILAAAGKLLTMLGPLQELSELRERIDQIEGQASLRVVR